MPSKNKTTRCKTRLLPPWFVSKRVLTQIEKLLPTYYHKRFSIYFEYYGCVRCGLKAESYVCNGLCYRCLYTVQSRLRRCDTILAKKYKKPSHMAASKYAHRIATAREILADLVPAVLKITQNKEDDKPATKSDQCSRFKPRTKYAGGKLKFPTHEARGTKQKYIWGDYWPE
jgi:hypothetical protein